MSMNRKTSAGIRKGKEKDAIVKNAKIPMRIYIFALALLS